ncbi:DEAD/DEAH box helicase family protein [Mesorhizobium sp.]|uniref:DEAD/DEAH box helicase family protein n=1 Tax=Mesorhizobium sp. TaxID=1871066 RepID=UPI000FE7EE09|nr:DEAD/DEAH box helicase family protein [Mesorhizobium sp.]RWG01079.1 MAG: DEAD/DEAH box helicase [Mesorhizobium sp.]RWG93434.1 MAG: DEAD/DEAH box helicase [Mesorhizobium sp.]TIN48357.1 MAG: DEAD/DEAH box helicase [Mesorhizobium sp.]TIR90832.1 MAG: DEAD/DEAH box helicase [Mesorhizobium sp.]
MPDLSQLILRTSYHKGRDDIARDFYLPCMTRSSRFDRAVGYFRSTVFIVAWPALKGFVQRGGKIHVLCSQVLADSDVQALESGYAGRIDSIVGERLREEVSSLLRDAALRDPAKILAGLVARGALDLQIAVLRESELSSAKGRLFHDKLGIFRDNLGHVVVFKGSMNETWTGLAADGNLESVDVAANWLGARDVERCNSEEAYFDQLWGRTYPGLLVRPFPEVARNELVRAAPADLEGCLEETLRAQPAAEHRDARGRVLKPHQSSGLAAWVANDRRGVLAFATGAGKTFTAITAIREALTRYGNVVLIIVPDQTLFDQWESEIRETTADLNPRFLRAGAGHSRWRETLRPWTTPSQQARIVLATVQTASSEVFRAQLHGGAHLMLVADEVHRLGSRKHRQIMDDRTFGPRLGLSATPERYGDPQGTKAILEFFGGVLQPRYTLVDAIRDGVLTQYFYRPHPLRLEPDETEQWKKLSREVARLQARMLSHDPTPDLTRKLQNLLVGRARIVKQARAKVQLAVDVFTGHYETGQQWLVYCDDGRQLDEVNLALTAAGIPTLAYHSAMEGDRAHTLAWLARRGGVVTAIKCLDEGVDIPSVTHALILASSKNPREFVQRRGRVLRKAEGKALAHIHDAIVLAPRPDSRDDEGAQASDPMTVGELARAIEFATYAANPASATDLQQIAIQAGLDWTKLTGLGTEDAQD